MLTEELALRWFVILMFNGATIKLLTITLGSIDIARAMEEKKTLTIVSKTEGKIDSQVAGARPAPTSYSRIAGMVGAVVLATFLWSLGNIIIYMSFGVTTEVKELLESISAFFLAGASLFAPYAFNQLGQIFSAPVRS